MSCKQRALGSRRGVGGEDAVHVRVDLHALGTQGGAEGEGGGVGAAAAQGGDVLVRAEALEAGDDDEVVLAQLVAEALGVDAGDAGAVEGVVGVDAGLGAAEGDGGVAAGAQGEGEEGGADQLAAGEEHVVLAAGGAGDDGAG